MCLTVGAHNSSALNHCSTAPPANASAAPASPSRRRVALRGNRAIGVKGSGGSGGGAGSAAGGAASSSAGRATQAGQLRAPASPHEANLAQALLESSEPIVGTRQRRKQAAAWPWQEWTRGKVLEAVTGALPELLDDADAAAFSRMRLRGVHLATLSLRDLQRAGLSHGGRRDLAHALQKLANVSPSLQRVATT